MLFCYKYICIQYIICFYLQYFTIFIIDDVILNKSVADHFKSIYKNVKYTTDDDWAPYESKTFIELAFVVHKNPKVKSIIEVKSTAKHQGGGLKNIEKDSDVGSTVPLQDGKNTEIYFSEVTTQRELDMIFGISGSNNSSMLPKTTLIEGAPGIGKTVVAREIASRWARNIMLPKIKLLLLINLNKIDMNKITNFEKLMQDCHENKNAASSCANYFVNSHGKNLMIIFDGYDEMATEDQKKDDTFLTKLLKRESLPECHLVVTSRPYITAHLHHYCNCRVEIMGFTENDRLSYFKENLSNKKFQMVTKFLQKHPIIDSFCYIPLHLINFLSLVKYDMELPETQTELTGNTIRLTIARNKRKDANTSEKLSVSVLLDEKIDNIIASVAGFAYKMLEKEQFVFSEEEMKTAGTNIEDNNDNYGLLKAVQLNDVENVQHKKVYSFVHFSVQEYLAAYHLSKMYSIAQSFALNHKFWDGKYFGIWRMYAGLTKGGSFPFKAFLSNESYFTASIRHFLRFKFAGIADEFTKNKVICLQLYQIFLEAPDSEMKESLSTVIKNDTINLSEETLSITDTNILSYFIAKSSMTKEWQTINLSECGIDDDKLQSFYQGLCIEDGREKPIINNLNISNNKIWKLNTIINLIAKFKIVHLKASNNSLTYKHVMNVEYFNNTLKILDLSYNLFESEDVCNLCNALVKCKNLEELYLNNNHIDESAESYLIAAIVQWDNLREFKCKHNAFSNPSCSNSLFEFTVKHLKYINDSKETKVINFEETDDIANFVYLLTYAKHLSGKNSKYISHISQLRRLSLQCAESHTEHISLKTSASIFFQNHFKLLEAINLSGLIINEESAHNLVAALGNKLQYLKMNNCKLTSKVAKFLAGKIKIIKNIKELQLCNNCIDDEATKDLLLAFLHCNSFEAFKFEGNKFEDKSKSLFKFLLSHLKFSGLSLNLSDSLDGITSFITLLEYMKEVSTVESVYVENVSKVRQLNLNCLGHQTTNMQLKLTIPSSQGFQIFNQLESLNLSGISISENTANYLIRAFADNLQLEQLFMNNCQITSPTMNGFCQQLKLNSLKVFELSGNFIDDEATEELAIAVLQWNLLEYVKLDENQFSSQGMLLLEMLTRDLESEVIIDFINNHDVVKSFIEVLDYASNNSGKGVQQFLSNLKKVTKMSLQVENHLEMTFNASTTLQNLRNISSLNISGIVITDQVAKSLCVLFDNNQISFTQLIMNACKLNSKKILSFVHKLKYTDEITDAEFCNNKIDDDATKPLVIAILHWKKLKTLRLENNCFTEKSSRLFEILKEFSCSTSLSINYNGKVDKIIPFITLLGYMMEIDINNSTIMKNVSKIEKLLLDCSEQNINIFIVNASKIFTRFVNLTDLNISGMMICQEVADNLAEAFDNNSCSLEFLVMNNCQLTSEIAFVIIIKLRNCLKMRELQLCNNFIDDEITEKLAITIFHWNSLKCVKFDENQFSSQGMLLLEMLTRDMESEVIIDFINNHNVVKSFIEILDYASNNSGKGVQQFLSNLKKVTEVSLQVEKHLEMTFNASTTLQNLRNISSLNISGIIINDQVAKSLCVLFDNNQKSFTQLIMNTCKLNSKKILSFVHKLRYTDEITDIEFCNNEIDDDATKPLVIAILHWKMLKTLRLENNCFTENSKRLFEILNEFSNSASLSINYNGKVDKIISFITLLGYIMEIDINNSMIMKNVSKIEKLLLDCSEQNNTIFIVNASRIFTRFVNLTDLNISGMVICQEVADNLAKAFDNNLCSLEYLVMNNCRLTSEIALKIIIKIRNCLKMRELQLCNNFIGDDVMRAIVITIFQLNCFKEFKFEGNQFSCESESIFQFLLSHLKFSASYLDLSDNLCNLTSFITLLGYMKEVPNNTSCYVDNISKVHHLDLNCLDQQTSLELTLISSEGFQIFNHLISLNISGLIISANVASCLVKAFSNNLQLEQLFINNCHITSFSMNVFCQQLKLNSLKIFEVSKNFIDDEATEELVIAVLHWNLLEIIKFEENQFSTQGMLLLEMLTRDLESYVTIDFINNHDVVKSFIEVLDYASNNGSKGVQQFLSNLMKVTGLSLRVGEPIEITLNASNTLRKLQNITIFDINGILITEQVANNICALLGNNCKSLNILLINNSNLSCNAIVKFAHMLKSTVNVIEAQFCGNKIDDFAAKDLAIAILHWNKLKTLKLENNNFTENNIEMFEILKQFLKFLGTSIHFGKVNKIIPFITLLGHMMHVDVKDSVLVENITKVQKLQLDCSEQNNSNVQFEIDASNFFTRFINLTVLNISGIAIGKEVTDNLVKAFDCNLQHTLEHLIMNKCQLISVDNFDLCLKLKNCLKLKELQLLNNYLDDKVTEALVVSILYLNELEILKVDQNRFSKNHEKLLTFLAVNLNVFSSVIYYNDTDKVTSFIALLEYMQMIPVNVSTFVDNVSKLRHLSLVYMSDEKLDLSVEASQFFQRFNLTKLNISGLVIKEVVIDNLLKAFGLDLQCLFMNNCNLSSGVVIKLMQNLQQNAKNIKKLELCNNFIDDEATEALAITCLHWNSLECMKIENNLFTENSIEMFKILKDLKYINTLPLIDFIGRINKIIPFITLLGYMMNVNIKDSVLVGNVSKVKKLLLDCSNQNHNDVQFEVNASMFFTRFIHLTDLNISGIIIPKKVADNLAKALDVNLHTLEHLIMNKCQLSSVDVLDLSVKLKNCVKLKELQLFNNYLDDKITEALIVSILHLNELEILRVDQNLFSEKYKKVFTFLTKNLKFSSSSINYNDTDRVISFIALLEYMQTISVNVSTFVDNISKVKHLKVYIPDEKLELSVEASQFFKRFNLTELNISGLVIKEVVIDNLLKAFGTDLQRLFMNNCNLSSGVVIKLMQKLQNAKNIKKLELCNNFIDDEATEALATAILHWNSLECIETENNQFSTQGILLLEMLTRDLESDVTIDFINNPNVVKSFIEILDYASNNSGKGVQQFLSNLKKVTKVSLQVEKHLEMTFNASTTLQNLRNISSLNISGIIITDQVAKSLCVLFDNNQKSFTQLIMNACKLNSKKILSFVHKLRYTDEITNAEFCNNKIDDDATKPLVISILHWKMLKTLRLENNCFTENSKRLFEILKEFSNSTSLSINYNGKVDKINPFITLLGYMMEIDINNSMIMKNVSKIEKLFLDCSEQNNSIFIANASKIFTRFVNLTDLNISGMVICQEVADNLAKAFDNNLCSLEYLVMNNCQLTSEIALKIIIKIRNCLKMRELQLCNNFIGDDVMRAIVITIFQLNCFKEFKFEGNQFSCESESIFQFLLSHLNFSASYLDLSDNLCNLTSFITLLGYMKEVPNNTSCYVDNISKVHHLDLNCLDQQTSLELTNISSEGFQIFNCLISLNISGLIISANVASCLVKAFSNNLQLEQLFMNNCHITSPIMIVFCQQLKFISLKVFELSENFIDDEATEELAIAIFHWNSLECIKLENNHFSSQGMLLLQMLTRDLKSNVIIDFTNNYHVVKSFIEVLDYTSNNSSKGVQQFLSNLIKITKISLQVESPVVLSELKLECVDTDEPSEFIKNTYLSCKQLRSLKLHGIYFTSSNIITILADCLTYCFPLLQELILSNCNLDSKSVVRLLSNKQRSPMVFQELTKLDLSNNFIDINAINSLVNSILQMPKLTSFCAVSSQVGNYLNTIFKIILDWKSAKSSVTYYKTSDVDETDHISAFIAILCSAKDIYRKDLCQINNIIKINKLVLKNTHYEAPLLNKDASFFMKRFTTLQELNLTGVYIEQNAISVINDALTNNLASLQILVLCKCMLNSDSAKALLLSSKNAIPVAFNTLKEVDLSHNHITDEVIELLISSFIQMPNLIKLNLDNNKFDTKAMSDMIFEFKTVSSTVFKNDNTSVKYFIAMLSSMKKFSTEHICQVRNITEVENLTLQSIERVKLHENASLFFQRFTKLSILRLFGFYIEPQSIANLSRALVYNLSSLEELMLSNCKLDSKSAVKLLSTDQETIPVCFGKLRIIDFSCNLIDDDALKPLLNSFLQIPNLQKPHLYCNNFTNIMAILIILYDWRNYKTSEINYSNRHDARAYTSAFFTLVSCIEDAIFEESLNKNITAVNSLSLANHDHDNPIILTEIVATFFLRFTNLTELNLSGIHIHKETMKNLGYTLQNNPGLLNLKLNYCQLDSDLVKKMLYPGGRRIVLMNLKTFDLSFNNIDNKANSVLIQSLIEMPKLESLKVTGNKFSRSDERAFNSVLSEFCTYKSSINYSKADNSTECIEAFLILLSALNDTTERKSNQIQNITRVEILHLHCKEYLKLSKEASLFFVNFFRLTTLNLSGICITAIVSKNLAKALQNNHHFLQILVLSQCKLDYESVLNLFGINTENTATQLSKTLITFHSLSTLDISNNDIMNDAARPLITLFLQMPKLVELNIDGNYFSVETFIALEFMFAFNKGISIIDSTYPTICRYRPQNISNSFSQKPRGRTYYGSLLHYDYSFVNLYCMYNRTIISYKPSVYALAFIDLLECAKNVNSIQVRNILKIEKLILDCVEQKDTTLSKDGFIFLNSLANLKELKLNGVSVNTEAVTVEKFNHLQKLTLAKCHLSSEATITILSLLNKCTIIDLCLSHNHITCKAGEAIKEFVDKNNTLINIDLSSNEFKDEGATIIIQSLCTCFCLKTFNLSHNRITDEFTYQLVTSLLKMPNCVEVDIKGNNFKKHIDIKSITKIITNCKNMQPVVTYKSLDYVNSFITLIGCLQSNHHEIFSQSKNISTAYKLCLQSVIFCKLTKEASLFFKNFGNLIEMKLNGIFINTAARRILAETIAINLPSLKFLELSHCGLDSSSAIAIVSSLKRKQIKELCLSQNKIDYNATSALKRFLENNIILNKFDISYNHIGTEGIKIISPTFVGCKGLESLNLSYNDITDEATVPLVSSLVQMPNLTEVQYHGNDDCDIPQVLNTIAELKTTQHFHQTFHSDEEVSAFLKLLACVKDVPTENSQQVRNLRKIEKLCLKLSSHNQPINETAALVIKQFTRLTTLNFQGITIANLGVAEIMADALSSNLNSLQYLRLSNCKLDSNLIIALLPSNKPSVPTAYKVLQEIDLTNNNICDKAIVSLTASLLQMCQLKKLHFDRNQLKNYNIKTIFQIIVELKVTKSTVEYFNNGKDSADYVPSFLSLLSSAKDISLEASQQVKNITNVSKLTLCCTDKLKCVLIEESSIFFERFTSLQTLDFYGIKFQLQAVTVFAKALALNLHSLEKLNLSACELTPDTTIEIISSLRKEKLKVLCLSHNELDFNSMKVISNFVVNNTILTEINISHNEVNTEGILTLTEGLSYCRNLEKLDLSHNKITDDATESLHKLMKQFYQYGNFKSLQIDNNYLSQQSIKTIQSAVS